MARGKTKKGKVMVGTRNLASLHEFPTQSLLYPYETPDADMELAEDIRVNGLKHPIEILPENKAGYPANTILCGHRRRRALLRLGHEEYKVRIRYDLATATAAEIEEIFISDNEKRRQMTTLGRVRLVVRRFEIEKERKPGDLNEYEQREARDRVGTSLGMSGRNLQRYYNVLQAPTCVQQAFEEGAIGLILTERVARLPAKSKRQIAKRIAAGEDLKQVISEFTKEPSKKPKHRGTAVKRFIKDLSRSNEHVAEFDLSDFKSLPMAGHEKVLKQAISNCKQLLHAFRVRAQKITDSRLE